jgi:hypothetical protein
MTLARSGVDALALWPEQAEDLGRTSGRAAEPVRHSGVELDHLAGPEYEVAVAEDQPEPTGEDVEPLVALVCLQL